MAKLTCDICGGSLQMGVDGMIFCEDCGMKYSPEAIRQKVQRANSNNNNNTINNINNNFEERQYSNSNTYDSTLKEADIALDNKDYEEAIKLYERCLELKPDNPDIFYKKGVANLQLCIEDSTNISNACRDFNNSITKFSDGEQQLEHYKKINKLLNDVCTEIVKNILKELNIDYTMETIKKCLKELSKIFNTLEKFYLNLNSRQDGSNLITKLFGLAIKEKYFNYEYVSYICNSLSSIATLQQFAESLKLPAFALSKIATLSELVDVEKIRELESSFNNLQRQVRSLDITTTAIGESGFFSTTTYQVPYFNCPSDVKNMVNEACEAYNAFVKKLQREHREIELQKRKEQEEKELQKRKEQEEKERKANEEFQRNYEKYWAEHKDLADQLNKEQNELIAEQNRLQTSINESPEYKQFKASQDEYKKISNELYNLSVFKFKEKKLLIEQLSVASKKQSQDSKAFKDFEANTKCRIREIQSRIAAIRYELSHFK